MNASKPMENMGRWIETAIKDFMQSSPDNTLRNRGNEKAWADPLVGFSRGDDPLYQEYRDQIGPFYLTPLQIFVKTFPQARVRPDEITVISWILPQTEATKSDNRKQTRHPAERWVRARIFGEEFNDKLRTHVVATLQGAGYEAVAPLLSPLFEMKTSERYGFASTWSERHAAYASGLGTFGLSDGLITPKGKAMRCGSVVANIEIPPTERRYDNPNAYCLFLAKGLCGKCIDRCPARAINKDGHDKVKCRKYLHGVVEKYAKSQLGLEGQAYGCGFCQTAVPCESKIPTEQGL